jgi:hypothetical protein
MRAALAFMAALMAVQPAHACHRFKRWSYPWPQRCGTVLAQAAHLAPKLDERVSIEITITSELLETWARQDAVQKLKGELK